MRSLSRIGRPLAALLAGGLIYIIIGASVVTSAAPTADIQPALPLRVAFYYPWFPEAWHQQGSSFYTNYTPTLGSYSSTDPAVISQHIAAMQYGGIQAGIAS